MKNKNVLRAYIARYWKRGGYTLVVCVSLLALGVGAYQLRSRPTPSASPTPSATVAPTQTPQAQTALARESAAEETLAWPMDTRVILTPHQPDQPYWSKALGQYETHSGVDIQAVPGQAVYAAADGRVSAVYTDALMGCTVKIEHADGLVTIYQNLLDAQSVTVGERVLSGALIGAVGTSAIAEDGAHLHFEAWRNGSFVALRLPDDEPGIGQ